MNAGVIHYHSDEKHKVSESPGVVRAKRRFLEVIIFSFINAVCLLMQVSFYENKWLSCSLCLKNSPENTDDMFLHLHWY